VDYYLVVDGYEDPLAQAGPSQGAFELTVTLAGSSICGNDAIENPEVCDDGNTDSCDGCHGDCSAAETGCGDGFVCGDEECDDGNESGGDGCSALCILEDTQPLADGGSQPSEGDAASPSNPGTGGTSGGGSNDGGQSNGGSSNGSGGDVTGGNPDADGSIDGVGGQSTSNDGKSHVKGGGGTTSTEPTQVTSDESSDSGSGCAMSNPSTPSNDGWLALLGLALLRTARRRTRR
jgi:MYXO-CTERM domain-containing protein